MQNEERNVSDGKQLALPIHIERLLTVSISVIALAVSSAALYYQSVHERSALSLQLMGFSMKPRADSAPVCKLDLALFNSGNRDSALIGLSLGQGTTRSEKDPSGTTYKTMTTTYSPEGDLPGYVTYVVKGGEVRLLGIEFPGCDADTVRRNLKDQGLRDFSLSAEALDHSGSRFSSSVLFARATALDDGRVSFSLRLDGQFDLLASHSDYAGDARRGSREFWFNGMGKAWDQGFSSSYRHQATRPTKWHE